MSLTDLKNELSRNEDQIKKTFGGSYFNALKTYTAIKETPFSFINNSNKMKALDSLMSNYQQLGRNAAPLFDGITSGITSDIDNAYSTAQRLRTQRPSVDTLNRYGIQYNYSDTLDDQIAQSAGLAPASFDISKYLPNGVQATDLMKTDEGASAVLDAYTTQQNRLAQTRQTVNETIAQNGTNAVQNGKLDNFINAAGPIGAGKSLNLINAIQNNAGTAKTNAQNAQDNYYQNYDIEKANARIKMLETTLAGTRAIRDKVTFLPGENDAEIAQQAVDISNEIDGIKKDIIAAYVAKAKASPKLGTYEPVMAPGYDGKGMYEQAPGLMTQDEKDVYWFIYNNYGEQAALDYSKSLGEEYSQRMGESMYGGIKDSKVLEYLYAPAAGFQQGISGLSQAFAGEVLPTSPFEYASQMARNDLNTGFGKGVYDTLYSTGQMLPAVGVGATTGVPVLGAATTALSSKGTAYKQALDMGYSKEQANTYAALTGASEGGLQYALGGITALGGAVTKSAVSNFIGKISNTLLRVSLDLGSKALSEGFEEGLQQSLDPIFRNIAFGENNQFDPLSEDVVYAFILGASTAGLLEVGNIDIGTREKAVAAIDVALSSGELNAEQAQQLQDIKNKIDVAAQDVQTQNGDILIPDIPDISKNVYKQENHITVYRGDTSGKNELERSLSRPQTIMDIVGSPAPEVDLLPFEYYSESMDAAQLYANRDNAIVEAIMQQANKTREQAIETFKVLYGKDPVLDGTVKSITISPKNVLDLTNLGENPTYNEIINKLLQAEGSAVPAYVKGENVNSGKWDNYNRIERDIMLNMPYDEETGTLPIYLLMKSKGVNDQTGRNFVNWLKSNNYDSVRYSEDGTSHYAMLNEASTSPAVEQNTQQSNPNTTQQNVARQDAGQATDGTKTHLTATSLLDVYKGTEVGDIITAEIKSGKANYTPESAVQNIEQSLRDVQNGVITAQNYDSVLDRNGDIKRYNKTDVADITALLYDAETRGDTQTAESLRSALYDAGLQLGRGTQAFAAAYALLRKSSPNVFLLSAEKEIARVNAEGQKKFPTKWTDVSLTAEEKAAILNAPTFEERTAIYESAQNRMRENMPSTTWEKLDQIRKTGMLFNLKTQARNFGGNVANEAMNAVARKVEAGLQRVLPKIAPKMFKGFEISIAGKIKPEYKAMIDGEWETAQEAFKNSGRYNIESKIGNAYHQTFKNAGLGKALNNLSKATGWLLDNKFFGDMAFGKHHYETALASFAQARGLTEITNEARTFAMERALEATFRSDSKAANAINALIKKGGGFGKLTSVVMPFVKTPINIAKQAFDYSALGLGKSLLVDTFRVRGGQLSATDYVHNLAKGITGTAVSALGFMLAKGLLIDGVKITGGAPDDKDKEAFMRSQGWQPYSLQIGDTYIPISWAQPVSSTLLMGVKVAEITDTDENLDFQDVKDIAGVLFDSVAEISPLSGVSDMFKYKKDYIDLGVGVVSDLAGQFVPAIAKQTVQTINPNIYDQYTSNPLETIKNQYATGFGLSAIDGVDVAQKVDPWGKPITQPDNVAARAGMNFLSPANLSFGTEDKVNNEISRLYESTKQSGVFPPLYDQREIKTTAVLDIAGKPITLSAKDLQAMQEGIGQASRTLVESYINSDQYAADSDAERAKTISGFYSDVKDLYELSKAYGTDFSKVSSQLSTQADAYFSGKTEYNSPVPDAQILAGDYLTGVDADIRDMLKGIYEETGNDMFLLDDQTFNYRGETYDYPGTMQQSVTDELGGVVSSSFFKQENAAAQEQIIRDTINEVLNTIEKDTVRKENPLATVQQDAKPDTSGYYDFNEYWKQYGTGDKVIKKLQDVGVAPKSSTSFNSADLLEGTHDWSSDEQQMIADATYTAMLKYYDRVDATSAQKIVDRVYNTFKGFVIDGRRLNQQDVLNEVYKYFDEDYEW